MTQLKKVEIYTDNNLYLKSMASVELVVKKTNELLKSIEAIIPKIKIDSLNEIFIGEELSFKWLNNQVYYDALESNKKVKALGFDRERTEWLLKIETYSNTNFKPCSVPNFQVLKPEYYNLVNNRVVLIDNIKEVVKDNCTYYAETAEQIERLNIVNQIIPLMNQLYETSTKQNEFDFSRLPIVFDHNEEPIPDVYFIQNGFMFVRPLHFH